MNKETQKFSIWEKDLFLVVDWTGYITANFQFSDFCQSATYQFGRSSCRDFVLLLAIIWLPVYLFRDGHFPFQVKPALLFTLFCLTNNCASVLQTSAILSGKFTYFQFR